MDATAQVAVADSAYMNRGNQLVALTFDTLRNSLLHAIGTQGMEGAIAFCNEKAYPITNIYADSAVIRRTSLRVRNDNNKPDSIESSVLRELEKTILTTKMPAPKIIRNTTTGEIHYFKPIILQAMCLNCHGTPNEQIQPATLSKINELYPGDEATSFKEGDLRGIWHIIFKQKR